MFIAFTRSDVVIAHYISLFFKQIFFLRVSADFIDRLKGLQIAVPHLFMLAYSEFYIYILKKSKDVC